MKISSIIVAAAAMFFYSCSSGNSGKHNAGAKDTASVAALAAYDNSLPKGVVTDSMECLKQGSQTFAYYLPTYYSSDRSFPCIYFFDAHARGSLPVRLYKDIAEKYGFILIGSNACKNGTPWPITEEAIKALMADTRSRMNIDPKRIYTSGFSGGSRVASSVAILDGGVAGVIGCAAGFGSVPHGPKTKFDYFGMAGDDDFNLTEMRQLDKALEKNGFAHQLLAIHGKHGWAAPAEFQTALLWIQLNAMKESLQSKNDTLVADLKNDYDKRVAAAAATGDLAGQHELLSGMAAAFDGLSDISFIKKQLAELESKPAYKNASALQERLQTTEISTQQELVKQFTTQDEKWWTQEITELNHNIHSAKTKQESHMYSRLLNYLGLVCYMNTSHALKTKDLKAAATDLKIFKMADPKNPDCSYLSAVYYMEKGSPDEALAALGEAASLGFSDVGQLMTDPTFRSLQDNDEFEKTVAAVRENTKSEK